METKIRNTIEVAYTFDIEAHNDEAGTSYAFNPDQDPSEPWLLVPSFADKSIRYTLRDDSIALYHAESYTQAGNPPRKTYYFNGLYVITKGPFGDM